MATVPLGVIVGWDGTTWGSIPAGWTPVSELNDKYPRLADTTGGTGGQAQHRHTLPAHNHAQTPHTHPCTVGTGGGSNTLSSGAVGCSAAGTHQHTLSLDASWGTNSPANELYSDYVDNTPEYWDLAWITPADGNQTGIPSRAVALWMDQDLPDSWGLAPGSEEQWLKGAPQNQPGGANGGTRTHTHTIPSHNHVVATGHSHTGTTSAYLTNVLLSVVGSSTGALPSHNHSVSVDSQSPGNSAWSFETGEEYLVPPSIHVAVIQNGTGGTDLPVGVICLWKPPQGGSIPDGWRKCDGASGAPRLSDDLFIKGVEFLSDIGKIEGKDSHCHSTSHTHAQGVHHHSVTGQTCPHRDDYYEDLYSSVAAQPDHSHTITVGDNDAAESGDSSVQTTDGSTPSHIPLYYDVVAIQYMGASDEPLGDCDDGTCSAGGDCSSSCPGDDVPSCEPGNNQLGSAWVGDRGGPTGGAPAPGFAGYIGGTPPLRWVGGTVSLEAVDKVGVSDVTGRVTLKHPTTCLQLTFAGGQSQPGPLGYNWTHDRDVRLVQFALGVVATYHESGRWDFYFFDGVSWQPTNGRRSSLTGSGAGWTETTPYGVEYNFPPFGSAPGVFLSSIVDPNGNRTTFSYDPSYPQRLTSVLDPCGQRVTVTYNASGRVQTAKDPAAKITTFSYDASGKLLRAVQHPDGARVTYSYNAFRDPVSITNPLGQTTTLAYTAAGRLQTITDPTNRLIRTITYDTASQRAVIVDARGGVWTNSYSTDGRPVARTDPLGRSRQNVWGSDLEATAFIDARGNRWTYSYDSSHRRTLLTSPLLCVHSYSYINNRVQNYRDPLGNRTYYAYDATYNLDHLVTPDNGRVTYTHYTTGLKGLVKDVRDARGYYTTYTYDALGNRQTVKTADGFVTTFVYDAANRLTATVNPLGHRFTSVYDTGGMGRLVATIDPLGNRTTYEYDALGRQTAVVDPLGHRTETKYDVLGQIQAEVDAQGHRATYAYDANGNRTSAMNPLGKVTTYAYDARDRLTAEVNPLLLTTSYDYDEDGRRRAVIDPTGKRTTTTYDAVGRPSEVIDALGHVVTTLYYDTGWVKATIDQNGNRTSYSYDGMGRTRTVKNALGQVTTYGYDLNGNQTIMWDARGNQWQSAYDSMNRLIASVDPDGGRTTYVYDTAGRRLRMTDPTGQVTSYRYDAANRVTDEIVTHS